MSSPSKYLTTYLNDHLAGATVGVELVRRAARENEGSELGAFLARLAVELVEDRDTLKSIIAGLGAREDRLKVAGGWLAEKVGRLKLNGQLRGYSPLSPLVELEGLRLGITGKLSMWEALGTIAGAPPLDAARLGTLVQRARDQLERLEAERLKLARTALA